MAIKVFYRIGLVKEFRGSFLMKFCNINKEVKCFRKGRGVFRCSCNFMGWLGVLWQKYGRDMFFGVGKQFNLYFKREFCIFGNGFFRVLSVFFLYIYQYVIQQDFFVGKFEFLIFSILDSYVNFSDIFCEIYLYIYVLKENDLSCKLRFQVLQLIL